MKCNFWLNSDGNDSLIDRLNALSIQLCKKMELVNLLHLTNRAAERIISITEDISTPLHFITLMAIQDYMM